VAVGVIKTVKRKTEKGDWIISGGKQDGQTVKADVAMDKKALKAAKAAAGAAKEAEKK